MLIRFTNTFKVILNAKYCLFDFQEFVNKINDFLKNDAINSKTFLHTRLIFPTFTAKAEG